MAAFLLITGGGVTMKAQDELMLSQHWALPTFYNPANTGNTDFLRIRGGARLQWLGIENAPRSFFGAADTPFLVGGKRIGVGVTAMQESLGLFANLNIGLQVSYKLNLGKGTLSIGLQPAYFNSQFKGSKVVLPDGDDYHQGSDTSIPTQDLTGNHFDLSAGISWTHRFFTVGLSCMHLLNPKVNLTMQGSQSNEQQQYQTELPRQLYLIADGNIPLKNTLFELQPSLLLTSDLSWFTGEIAMRATYNKFLSFGVLYRYQDAVGVTIGGEYKNFFLGYAYEYPLSGINKASSGSHELVAGYSLKLDFSGKNKNKHRSIRLM
ncbi:MAG: PorP/SprF family type IX secretion system membrane protein [Muribaculaceae bacterium]|nr:PorP/SprF family type IX secretion system membrane protein [Muribaculaceae bacterium]